MKYKTIVKIGGSCSPHLQRIVEQLRECAEVFQIQIQIVIIPGGWVFADMIRGMELDNTTAHWMAVEAMDLYGHYISFFGIDTIDTQLELGFDFDNSGVSVLLPYGLVRAHDELPHSWDVTSDSIAIWVAHKMGFKEVIKLTDVDGVEVNGKVVEEIYAEDVLHKSTCIDRYSPVLMQEFGVDMFVCNGLKDRVKDYILRDKAVGTRIKAHK